MSRKEFDGLLEIAKTKVSFGIYAVEKNGYAEMINTPCKSITELKKHTRTYTKIGFKVHSNKI